MPSSLEPLAMLFLAARQLAHNAHHLVTGVAFHEDHEFFGELYGVYLAAYDGLVERMLGLKQKVDLVSIAADAAAKVKALKDGDKDDTTFFYRRLAATEENLREAIKLVYNDASIGTQNMLAALADESEVRSYKIGRRLM